MVSHGNDAPTDSAMTEPPGIAEATRQPPSFVTSNSLAADHGSGAWHTALPPRYVPSRFLHMSTEILTWRAQNKECRGIGNKSVATALLFQFVVCWIGVRTGEAFA